MVSPGKVKAGEAFVEMTLRGAKQFQNSLKRVGARMMSFGKTIAKVAAAGTAAIATFAVASVRHFAKLGDQLDKMSARTNISVEALSELKFAAEQTGSSIEDLENAVLKMNRRVGRITAGQGTGQQTEALEELGLSAERLSTMNTEQRLLAIAQAMADYGDQAAAAGLAQRAFGTSVDAILPLLLQGRDGIKALREEAQLTNATMSTEQARAAAEFTDAMNRMRKAIEGLVLSLGSELAPTLTDVANLLAEVFQGMGSEADRAAGRVESAFSGVADVVAGLIDFVADLRIGFAQLGAIVAQVNANMPGLTQDARKAAQRTAAAALARAEQLQVREQLGGTAAERLARIRSERQLERRTQSLLDQLNAEGEGGIPLGAGRGGGGEDSGLMGTIVDNSPPALGQPGVAGSIVGQIVREARQGMLQIAGQIQGVLAQGMQAVSVEVGDRSARGTFSAAGARQLGRQGGVQEKHLEATLQTNRLLNKAVDAVRDLQLRWGS